MFCSLGGLYEQFNSKIALALLSALVNAHGGVSAMNSNTNKSISGSLSGETGRFPAVSAGYQNTIRDFGRFGLYWVLEQQVL